MSEQEKKISMKRVKSIVKEEIKDDGVRLVPGSSEFLAEMTNEFIQLISLAAIDKSERSKSYVDSVGVLAALRDLGFEDIIDKLPDLSQYTEDMHIDDTN